MPILVTCKCGKKFRADEKHSGKQTACPKCGQALDIIGPIVSAYDVFVSYSSNDKTTCDALCATFEGRGLRCWIAPRDILPGMNWGEAIINGIEQCRVMVLVFSAHSNESPQVKREVERAVSKGLPVIPLRIEDVKLSRAMEYFISSQHWLDALTPPLENHLTELARKVSKLLADDNPSSAPEPNPSEPESLPMARPIFTSSAPTTELPTATFNPMVSAEPWPGVQSSDSPWSEIASPISSSSVPTYPRVRSLHRKSWWASLPIHWRWTAFGGGAVAMFCLLLFLLQVPPASQPLELPLVANSRLADSNSTVVKQGTGSVPDDKVGTNSNENKIAAGSSIASPTATAVDSKVPADAVAFRGHSYKYFGEKLSWKEAKARCEKMGGHLPFVETAVENAFLYQLADKGFPLAGRKDQESIWLGATDEVTEGEWRWIDGSRVTYTNWLDKQPGNADGNEHYLQLCLYRGNSNRDVGGWADLANVSEPMSVHFICEWDSSSIAYDANQPDYLLTPDNAGPSVDLLALMDPIRDAIAGKWTRATDGLQSDITHATGRIKCPYALPEEYDFRIEFTPHTRQVVMLLLSHGGREFALTMGAFDGSWDAFDVVNKKALQQDGQGLVGAASRIKLHQRNRAVVQIRKDSIAAFVNDVLVARHSTDYSDLNLLDNWSVGPGNLGLGTTLNQVRFHKVELFPIGSPAPTTETGWTELFNGRDSTGWSAPILPNNWEVRNGTIAGKGLGLSALFADETYGDFELDLEYKLTPGSNAGIWIRAPNNTEARFNNSKSAMGINLLDDASPVWAEDVKDSSKRTGGLHLVTGPNPIPIAPAGIWHRVQVHAVGPRITVALNGTQVLDVNTTDYVTRLQEFTGLMRTSGYIGLEDHGEDGVEFRNIRIRDLSAAAPASDLDAMQGTWGTVAEEYKGAAIPADEFLMMKKTLTINGGSFVIERSFPDGTRKKLEGTIQLIPDTSPKQFNWSGTDFSGNALELLGMYELGADTLRIVYTWRGTGSNAPRPTKFASAGEGGGSIVNTFRRSAAVSETKWTDLFANGKLTGWTPVASTGAWTVKNGIVSTTPGEGSLLSDRDYSDFELELEYRLSKKANSGVFIRTPSSFKPSGSDLLEIQLQDDGAFLPTDVIPLTRTGSIFRIIPAAKIVKAPPEVWNTTSIRAVGPQITVIVNGQTTVDASLNDYAQLTKDKPNATRPAGRIGLQRRLGSSVEFRKIRIRELN